MAPIDRSHSRERLGERLGRGDATDPNAATPWLVVPIISNYLQVIVAEPRTCRSVALHSQRESVDSL